MDAEIDAVGGLFSVAASEHARRAVRDLGCDLDNAKPTESPIEEALLAALLSLGPSEDYGGICLRKTQDDGRVWNLWGGLHHEPEQFPWGPDGTAIEPQAKIGAYRVDFRVTHYDRSGPSRGFVCVGLVVECDGHDFHEKTKAQAQKDKARDRFLAAEGYTVLRFTGSEIWADPLARAEEVLATAAKVWAARMKREG